MERLLGFGGKIAVHGYEVAGPRSLAGDNDLVVAQAGFERQFRRFQSGNDHALVDDFFGIFA